ncbi:MAG: hypothetical protein Q7U30_00540, partial [Methylicorpusculum sp.]|nr:hypothetical protein [Methylicorpusculum sp.]
CQPTSILYHLFQFASFLAAILILKITAAISSLMIKKGVVSFAGMLAERMLPSSPHGWVYGVHRKAYATP